jgi:peptidoglycan/LPS O-acetylase OafA/YrhL
MADRVRAMTKHRPGLDHLRALAIAMVFLFHYRLFAHPAWVDAVGDFGWTGVDLFFVLSGYLIAAQLFVHPPLRDFFIKRALRILPAYFVVVAIYFLVPSFHERESLPPLWRFLTFTQNFGLDLETSGTFSHAWSLCVEEQFYLALPIMLWVAKGDKRWLVWLPLLVMLGLCLRWHAWQTEVAPLQEGTRGEAFTWYRAIYYPTYQRLDGLVAGVALAAVMTFSPTAKRWIERRSSWLLIAALTCLVFGWLVFADMHSLHASVFGFPIVATAYGLLVASSLSESSLVARVPPVFSSLLAKLSFAIYLVHKGVIHLVQTASGTSANGTETWWLCIAATLAAAGLLHVAVEKPASALRRYLTPFPRARAPTAESNCDSSGSGSCSSC